jgi:TatD DNase family protein
LAEFELIDFHCHLDLYPDLEHAISECERRRVFTLAVTTTPKAWPRNNLFASKTRYVRAALGLHPQLVAERANEYLIWERYLPETRYVGEVGLDGGPRFYQSLDLQKQIFEKVLRACADAGGKIITVHSVRATRAVLDMIEAHLPASRGRVVLHWFTGTKSEAQRAIELGCIFSINAEMLRGDRHRGMIESLPIEALLTETDGPFTSVGDRPTTPADVITAVETLAELRAMTPGALSAVLLKNLKDLVIFGTGRSSE